MHFFLKTMDCMSNFLQKVANYLYSHFLKKAIGNVSLDTCPSGYYSNTVNFKYCI